MVQVVDSSSRTLRATRDTHRGYGNSMRDGRRTLQELRRAERRANATLAISFAFFLVVVAWVLPRRLQRSNTAMLVRPAMRVALIPARAASYVFTSVSGRVRGRFGKRVRNVTLGRAGEEKGEKRGDGKATGDEDDVVCKPGAESAQCSVAASGEETERRKVGV